MIFAKGQVLIVTPTAENMREKYPAANWLTEPTKVILRQRCLSGQTNPVKVVLANGLKDGSEKAIYGFNIDRISS